MLTGLVLCGMQQQATERLQEQLGERQAEVEELQRESRSSSQSRMEASQALQAASKAEQEHLHRQKQEAEAEASSKYESMVEQSRRHARQLEVSHQMAGAGLWSVDWKRGCVSVGVSLSCPIWAACHVLLGAKSPAMHTALVCTHA